MPEIIERGKLLRTETLSLSTLQGKNMPTRHAHLCQPFNLTSREEHKIRDILLNQHSEQIQGTDGAKRIVTASYVDHLLT